MSSCEDDEYYEMNFAPMSGLPSGVATINRESLPWQLLVAANKVSHDCDAGEVHGIKCWDSNKIVDLNLEDLPDHPMYNIISLSTGHFTLNPEAESAAEHIIVAIVGIFQKKKKKSEKKEDICYTKMISFYENKNFGTDKDVSADVGTLINTIILNDKIKENIVPYRLSHKVLSAKLNTFILLTNQGCYPIVLSKSSYPVGTRRANEPKQKFQLMDEGMKRVIAPEFCDQSEMAVHGAALAIDIKIFDRIRYSCIGYEDGYCVLFKIKINDDNSCEIYEKWEQYYSATVSSILFLKTGELLIAAMWEGVTFYSDLSTGFAKAEFVKESDNYDAVTSLCNAKRHDGAGFCVGTFGKMLLVYSIEESENENCKLKWKREFRTPVLQIRSFDITGDGLQDIAVLSSGGLHLLQVNYRLVVAKLVKQIQLQSESL